MKYFTNKKILNITIFIAFALIFVLSMFLGDVKISFKDLFSMLSGKETQLTRDIILLIRLPRFLKAAIVGGILSICGVLLQTIFRNPLADPYLLGASAASQLGASVIIALGVATTVQGISLASIVAFIFSILTMILIIRLSRGKFGDKKIAVLLLGIAISYVLNAITNLIATFKSDVFLKSTFWSLKGFSTSNYTEVLIAFPFLLVGIIFSISRSRELNIYLSSDLTAHSLGINIKKFVPSVIIISSLLVSVSVMIAGSIAFVGLFFPRIAAEIVGEERKSLIKLSIILGMTLLPLFDLISRIALPSVEIPLNTITSLLGAPFFIYLFLRERNGIY